MRLLPATLAAALVCTPLSMIGCAGGGASNESAADPTPVLAEPVQIIVKVSGDQLPIASHGIGLLSADAVDGMGLREQFAQQGLPLDLSVHSVVLFSLGEQSTGGYSADINGLQLKGDTLYVQATAVAPGANATTTQAITYPYAAAATPKLPGGLTILSDVTSLP